MTTLGAEHFQDKIIKLERGIDKKIFKKRMLIN